MTTRCNGMRESRLGHGEAPRGQTIKGMALNGDGRSLNSARIVLMA